MPEESKMRAFLLSGPDGKALLITTCTAMAVNLFLNNPYVRKIKVLDNE